LVADREPPPAKLDDVLETVERRMIDLAMKKTKGDQTAAAEMLGIYRSRLVRRLKAFESGEKAGLS
jgi:DNA-binding protein Fis